ncbi:LacI family transcriptional regulator [Subtercola boreus]|uniref:LacI family transcriptional regulator n=1 Tax=Subtercola boreus TaxID=120213 RepID=A0A3E0W0M9_9MICO|nr:LacI family DNA-binding transcriptional regulator [Subtercola boreus]RFA15073.1 LacI family transcriptional regulator [Subtercola boreus]
MSTMQDVAKLAGVSAKTVSRVFNDELHVSPAKRDRVNAAMAELNYVPNMLARTFREGKASVLAIAVPDLGDPFFASIIRAIDQVAQRNGHAIAVTSLGHDADREQPIVEALLRRQMDGFIIAPISNDQSYLAKWLVNVPLVFVDREPANIAADLFVEDDKGAAHAAVQHLLQHGHTDIAFIGDSENVITTRRRLEGYREALAAAGIPRRPERVLLTEPENASELIAALLSSNDSPTAVFSSNSRTSQEIFPTLQQLNQPRVALVSFGDFPMAAALQPSVTVVDQNPERLGRAAAERLFARLDEPTKRYRRRNVFTADLIERASSAEFVGEAAAARGR